MSAVSHPCPPSRRRAWRWTLTTAPAPRTGRGRPWRASAHRGAECVWPRPTPSRSTRTASPRPRALSGGVRGIRRRGLPLPHHGAGVVVRDRVPPGRGLLDGHLRPVRQPVTHARRLRPRHQVRRRHSGLHTKQYASGTRGCQPDNARFHHVAQGGGRGGEGGVGRRGRDGSLFLEGRPEGGGTGEGGGGWNPSPLAGCP